LRAYIRNCRCVFGWFAKNARQFSLGVNLGEIVTLFFDVKLVAAQETENLCGLLNESLRNKHEKCPTT
jgi:hypothetical protein